MADIKINKKGKRTTLIISGTLTIEHAGEFRAALTESLEKSARLLVDIEHVTDMDLSSLQLLCSAHRTSLHLKKTMELKSDYPEALKQAVEDTGYLTKYSICSQNNQTGCLWVDISKTIQCQT